MSVVEGLQESWTDWLWTSSMTSELEVNVLRRAAMQCNTYDVDELDHCESELDGNSLSEVAYRSNQRVVAFLLKQRLYQSHLVVASQP